MYFSQSWGSRSSCQPIHFPGEGSLSGMQTDGCLLTMASQSRKRGSKPSSVSSHKGPPPIKRAPPLPLHLSLLISQRTHLQKPSTYEVIGLQHKNLEGQFSPQIGNFPWMIQLMAVALGKYLTARTLNLLIYNVKHGSRTCPQLTPKLNEITHVGCQAWGLAHCESPVTVHYGFCSPPVEMWGGWTILAALRLTSSCYPFEDGKEDPPGPTSKGAVCLLRQAGVLPIEVKCDIQTTTGRAYPNPNPLILLFSWYDSWTLRNDSELKPLLYHGQVHPLCPPPHICPS